MLRENRDEIGMKREKSFNQKKKERKREKPGKVYRFLLKYCIFILYSTVIFSYLKISLSFCDFYNNLSRQQYTLGLFLYTHSFCDISLHSFDTYTKNFGGLQIHYLNCLFFFIKLINLKTFNFMENPQVKTLI